VRPNRARWAGAPTQAGCIGATARRIRPWDRQVEAGAVSKREFLTLALTVTWAVVALSRAGDEEPADRVPVEVFPLPPNMTFERHVVGGDGVSAGTSSERLVYSNTLGTFAAALGAGNLVADDISINAPNGCKLRRLEFPVLGKVDPNGIGGPYSIDFALYSNCPGSVPVASRPGLILQNSAVHVDFADDGPRLISFIPSEGTDVVLLTNLWLGVKSSRNNAGVVVGAPALVGFSADQFDWPGFPCGVSLGGFPGQPHASFNAEIYADAECPKGFDGYKNNKPSGWGYNPGANVTFADDVQLGVDGCQMIGYEVAIKGVGYYTFDLREHCDGVPIPGTQNSLINFPSSEVKIARFSVDPPIAIPRNFWFAAKVNNNSGGVVVTGQLAVIGWSEDLFGLIDHNGCSLIYSPIPYIDAAVNLAITCAGAVPIGACCDMALTDVNGEAVCREVPQMNCPWPWPQWNWSLQPQWIEGAMCDPDPFPLSCGLAACCRPDDVCENLTLTQCNAVPPLDGPRQWQIGRYCGVDGQRCPLAACLAREGECVLTHDSPGCANPDCCTEVCKLDPWCCQVEWDRLCVQLAGTDPGCARSFGHDDCWNQHETWRALTVGADSSTFFANTYATESDSDPGFCCRGGAPGAKGLGTVWFKFTATDTSAKISTCNSDPAHDSLFQVFAAGDSSTEERACATLAMIACSDDVDDCGGGRHGKICVRNLVPGQTYYVMVASKTPETRGVYQLDIRSPCFEPPFWNADDCNDNGVPDGCEPGSATAADCNRNDLLDECDIARGNSPDCNANGVPDACDITAGTSLDCQPNGVPDECDLHPGNGVYCDCDDDGVPDDCDTPRARLVSDPPLSSFGGLVAMNGDRLLVGGDYEKRGEDFRIPALDVFVRQDSKWVEEARIVLPDEIGQYAYASAIALDGDRAFVSVPQYYSQDPTDLSAVYIYLRSESGWQFERKVTNPNPIGHRYFGRALDADQNRLAVSALRRGVDYQSSGEVFLYHREGSDWVLDARIQSPDTPELVDRFAEQIDLDGEVLAVGDYGYSGYLESRAGAVFIFRLQGTQWTYEAKIQSPVAPESPSFAYRIALRDNVLIATGIAGVRPPNSYPISGFVFVRQFGQWTFESELLDPSDSQHGYADSVAVINHGVVMMGSTGGSDLTTRGLVFARTPHGDWNPGGILRTPDRLPGEYVSSRIVGHDHTVIIGNPVSDGGGPNSVGAVYVFSLPRIDCQSNGLWDACETRDDPSLDCDKDGVPDECESLPPFDYDFDGDVDLIDLAGFQRCFTGPGPATVTPCCRMFDSDPDGDVDGGDFVAFNRAFAGP